MKATARRGFFVTMGVLAGGAVAAFASAWLDAPVDGEHVAIVLLCGIYAAGLAYIYAVATESR